MNCSDLFFDNNTIETLHNRTKLSDVVLAKGITKKDELIEFLKVELCESFGCDIDFWIQGSYKSRTLIKPVDKFSSYDIDIGVYLLLDAEEEDIESINVKNALKNSLESYCKINDEAVLQKSKNACEGLKYSTFLTIDTPIYYKTETSIKLATDNGWVESDAKSIQEWLTSFYSSESDRALMKRLVRYLKAWINVEWQDTDLKKIPSLAVNILVAHHMKSHEREDDSFIYTALSICEDLESTLIVSNPLNGSDLLAMPEEAESFAHQKFDKLKAICLSCIDSSEFERGVYFSNLFQHYFPQVTLESSEGRGGFPAVTTVPEISICRKDKDGKYVDTKVSDKINVRKGDTLSFEILNHDSFNPFSDAQWTVRNVGIQATDANDIGHKVIGKVNEIHTRETCYTGLHTMECMITYNGVVIGFKAVEVRVKPAVLIRRNKVFKGLRRK